MRRLHRKTRDTESNVWLGYTDLLSNSLFILLLTVAVTTLARANNDKPPLLRLTEQESFRFATGSYSLSPSFIAALERRLPEIKRTIAAYRVDTVEVIGHTDGQPAPGRSNLDSLLPRASDSVPLRGYLPGSNTDLGLLRALAVAQRLRARLDPDGTHRLLIRPYSASSLIAPDGRFHPADGKARSDRRRIELRFTRQGKN